MKEIRMIAFPMVTPPEAPGIYAIIHSPSKRLYIGKTTCLRQRHSEWRQVFVSGLGHKNQGFRDAIDGTRPEDWTFNVLAMMPGCSSEGLKKAEIAAIMAARRRSPEKLLNAVLPLVAHNRSGPLAPATIIWDGDMAINYSEAAERIGCKKDTLQKRLMRLRREGIFEIKIEALVAGTKSNTQSIFYPGR